MELGLVVDKINGDRDSQARTTLMVIVNRSQCVTHYSPAWLWESKGGKGGVVGHGRVGMRRAAHGQRRQGGGTRVRAFSVSSVVRIACPQTGRSEASHRQIGLEGAPI